MTVDYDILHELFQSIPTYGFGSIEDLEMVRLRFINISMALLESTEHKELADRVINKADRIGASVGLAMKIKNQKHLQEIFDAASNELAICIEMVLWNIYDKRMSATILQSAGTVN